MPLSVYEELSGLKTCKTEVQIVAASEIKARKNGDETLPSCFRVQLTFSWEQHDGHLGWTSVICTEIQSPEVSSKLSGKEKTK